MVYSLESFCNSVFGASYYKVHRCITKADYKEFQIPKKQGLRTIQYLENDSELAKLQHSLLINFLGVQPLPVCVKGFVKGESYQSFLSDHIGAKYFLRLDISSFFPSVNEAWIRDVLKDIIICNLSDEQDRLIALISDIVTLDGILPQGASTSPAMSNLVMTRIDQRITKYCQVFNIRYTRYADDLLFSSSSLNFEDSRWFLKKIKYILSSRRLKLNYSKLKYGKGRLILNGFVIDDKDVHLSRNRLADIRHAVSFVNSNYSIIQSHGSEAFLSLANALHLKYRDLIKYPFGSIFQFSQYLCGYRSFLISLVDYNRLYLYHQKELIRLIHRIECQLNRLV